MFSDLLLLAFLALLGILFVRAVWSPARAVTLGIGTYALEQIASIRVVWFQEEQAAFNILVAITIAASFAIGMRSGRFRIRHREARLAVLFITGFLAWFWLSAAWSPFRDSQSSWTSVPYFVVYVAAVPLLVEGPKVMLVALRDLFLVLLFGYSGTLTSGTFLQDTGRGVITSWTGGVESGANPLAFADGAAFLALIGVMLGTLPQSFERSTVSAKVWRYCLCPIGVVIGIWGAFLSSRGETLAAFVSCGVYILLSTSRRLTGATVLALAGTGIIAIALVPYYGRFEEAIVQLSPRFGRSFVVEGIEIRKELRTDSVALASESGTSLLFGIGARGCEERLGAYPHSIAIQAFAETGAVGLALLGWCYIVVAKNGVQALRRANSKNDDAGKAVVALFLSFLVYDVLVENKKGALTYPDAYMWLMLATAASDRGVFGWGSISRGRLLVPEDSLRGIAERAPRASEHLRAAKG